MKIGVPLGRLDEMLNGVNFGAELAYHLEVVLKLPSGFMDKPGATLSAVEQDALKALPQDDAPEDEIPLTKLEAVATEAPLAPPPANVSAAPHPAQSPVLLQESHMTEAVSPTSDADELAKREIRRANLAMLTRPKGVKSRLVGLTGLSAANISHRLHGHKLFDAETGEFFCQKLGLPSGWFETPKTEADIPPTAASILAGTTALPAVAPAVQPKTVSKTALSRPAGSPLAPTRGQKPAEAPTLSLSSASLGAAVVKTPRVSGVASRKKGGQSSGIVAAAPVVAPAPVQAAPVPSLAAHPAAAPLGQAAPVVETYFKAYLMVMNQKIQEGRVTEQKAVELLQSALAL